MSKIKLNVCGNEFELLGVNWMPENDMALIGPMKRIHARLEEAAMVYLSGGGELSELTIRQHPDRLELVREEVLMWMPWPPEIKIEYTKDDDE